MIYQPLPFESQRKDCEERYLAIREVEQSVFNKSLMDLCSANGYFAFRFMQDGGGRAFCVERDQDYVDLIRALAKIEKVNIQADTQLPASAHFDIGIYLDSHFCKGTEGYIDWLHRSVKVLYASPSGSNGNNEDVRLKTELKSKWKHVEPIYKGFSERIIYRCV